jgi:hypothetical protein
VPATAQSPVWGIGRAGDGDSLTVGETRVRLVQSAVCQSQMSSMNHTGWGTWRALVRRHPAGQSIDRFRLGVPTGAAAFDEDIEGMVGVIHNVQGCFIT